MKELPFDSVLVWRPEKVGYEPQTTGMVQVPTGQTEWNYDIYLCFLADRIQWMCDRESPESLREILEIAEIRIDPNQDDLGTAIMYEVLDRLDAMGILGGFNRKPEPDPLGIEIISQTGLGEWAMNLLPL